MYEIVATNEAGQVRVITETRTIHAGQVFDYLESKKAFFVITIQPAEVAGEWQGRGAFVDSEGNQEKLNLVIQRI